MKIVLMGYMGSGKSQVGNELSKELKMSSIDLDKQIAQKENRPIPEIFAISGEIYFRRKEKEVLESTLNRQEDFILSLGGGTPCYGNNLQLLKQMEGISLIYLKTTLTTLKNRLFSEKDSRPLISHLKNKEELEDFIRKHLFERTYYYNQASYIVETDSRTPKEVASEIILKLA